MQALASARRVQVRVLLVPNFHREVVIAWKGVGRRGAS
jgi:hypothetical protein